jgi:murein DD-endopeptidase MepM/ murein hydrolase activator NlpD
MALVVFALGPGIAESTSPTATPRVVAAPSYYRPVLSKGMAFPLARSNFMSLLVIFSDWHAPRLRLIGGRWLLVGVHEGIDIAAEPGTPVLAMEPGTVENAGWTFYSGLRVGIRGLDGRYYLFAHLSEVASGIVVGSRVDAGSVLGLVGNTGYGPPGHRDEFPPHLHVGIEEGTEWVDPYPALVSLYEATIRADRRSQAALDALAASGDTTTWERLARSMFMTAEESKGE